MGFLLAASEKEHIFPTTGSGVNCTAYKSWANVTTQTIGSELLCQMTGALSSPQNIVCKSSSDSADNCSTVLDARRCYGNINNEYSNVSTVQDVQTCEMSSHWKAIVIPIAGDCACVLHVCMYACACAYAHV